MVLYTCPGGKSTGIGPLKGHPCGMAAQALDEAGHEYEHRKVGGFKALPFTRKGKRDEIKKLTGQEDVPVLVLDEGEAIVGSEQIREWARAHPS